MEIAKEVFLLAVPKAAVINDLSGLGKCSLTAAIPVLAAMGVQACPLPTAVLSNQTGFSSYDCVDLTGHLASFAAEWKKHGAHFDGICTGFLCSPGQVRLAQDFIDTFGGVHTPVLVDPVLGDNGKVYPVFDEAMCRAVKTLTARADVITPNLTEACILAGCDYPGAQAQTLEPIWEIARRLSETGPRTVVITGVHQGDYILNLGYQADSGQRLTVKTRRFGGGFSGTGDILAAVLCGGLVRGDPLGPTLLKAAALLEAAAAETCADGSDPNDGIAFEHHLHLLIEEE